MISPAYTPFSASEAAQVLGFSWAEYGRAVASGLLEKNVHFDQRLSMTTGMHSLVDIVKCAVLRDGRQSNSPRVSERVDEFLDIICGVYDDEPEYCAMLTSCTVERILKEADALSDNAEHEPIDVHRLRAVIALEWARCYRQLWQYLMCDRVGTSG